MRMLNAIAKPRGSVLVVSAIAPLCLGLLLVFGGTFRRQSPIKSDIKIINKTTTLELASIRATDHNRLIIVFKNLSSKELNGYAIAVNGARITVDISSGDRAVKPGETDDIEIPGESSPPEVTILAAMFADGSIEGDPVVVAKLKEWRLGLKKQLTRALSVLNETLESPDVDADVALDKLESQFSSFPLESDNARAPSRGLRDGRDDLITDIQMLRQRRQRNGSLNQKKRLLELKGRIERRIARL